ncbi:hypothetical protein CL629_03235 [bacterium]|nr:hypothetical protein [bacterium]|tara:strand:+ start:10078 stop:10482 length:405 start_codon:yes stop_codon:yes gene_type:complete
MNWSGLSRVFSVFLIIFVVAIAAYFVFQVSGPLDSPRVSFLFRDGVPYAQIFIPYSCKESFRIFRSADRGVSWNRVIPPLYDAKESGCTLFDSLEDLSIDVDSLQYQYGVLDKERDTSRLSNASLLRLFRTSLF